MKIPITPKQLQKIWVVAGNRGMSEDDVKDIVERISGQRSTRALSKGQAIKIIDALENGAREWTVYTQDKDPKKIVFVSRKQLALIDKLKGEAGWDDEHLMNFILKYYKREALRKLRHGEAGALINILWKEMKKKREVA